MAAAALEVLGCGFSTESAFFLLAAALAADFAAKLVMAVAARDNEEGMMLMDWLVNPPSSPAALPAPGDACGLLSRGGSFSLLLRLFFFGVLSGNSMLPREPPTFWVAGRRHCKS